MTTPPHLWLLNLRLGQQLRQTDVEQRTHALGGRVYVSTLSELERGQRPLGNLRPAQITALRQVLHVTAAEWASASGQAVPSLADAPPGPVSDRGGVTLSCHEWLRARRLQLHLRRSDVNYQTQVLGGPVPDRTLTRLENGSQLPGTLPPAQISALRQVLHVTAAEWEQHCAPLPQDRESA